MTTSISMVLPPPPFHSNPNTPPVSPKSHRRQPSRTFDAAAAPLSSVVCSSPSRSGVDEIATGESSDPDSPKDSGEMAASRRLSRPPPLPDFKFNPGADLPPERNARRTHPILQEMALNQQRVSRSARPAPLPPFTFSPGPSDSNQASPSPTKMGPGEPSQPARVGHRRRGSELVGGGNEAPVPLVTNVSPEKPADSRPHGPPVLGGSRGHAHRRSQAVSISDIDTSELIKANAIAKARACPTPTTPSDGGPGRQQPTTPSYTGRSPPSSPRRRGSAPGSRPRVGFADHVDVIPRPLSLISSETEGSSSTVRGGHSLSGSINSLASPSPRPPSSTITIPSPSDRDASPHRPRTADPMTMLSPTFAPRDDKFMTMINLPKRPLSASGSPGFLGSGSPPKKKHFWFSYSNNASPTPTPQGECADPMTLALVRTGRVDPSELIRPKTAPGPSSSTKKRKYHTWTSGIFSKKAGKRTSKVKEKRALGPPPALTRTPSETLNDIFDADDTIVIRNASPMSFQTGPSLLLQSTPPAVSWSGPDTDGQVTSPIIDLDAALGPFGSEEKLGNDVHPRRVAAVRIAKLHSSERRANLDAFGAVHRRTESAPTMPAINGSTFAVHRRGSNTSLVEEVFDEEEEDIFLAAAEEESAHGGERQEESAATWLLSSSSSSASSSVAIPPPNSHQPEQPITEPTAAAEPTPATPPSGSVDGLGLAMTTDEPRDGVLIVDAEDDIAQVETGSSKSTIEAPIFAEAGVPKRPVSSPMSFAYPAPQSNYASSTEGRTTSASMISSPDAEHVSFDHQRRQVRYLGEPSPDFALRLSNDDLPSLSDSISSGAIPRISSSANTRSSVDQRSASMIVPSTSMRQNQAWKRASLASLNRLIPGSSNGSKLKFEATPDLVVDDKTKKKANRISKLMHFWRSKEKGEE